MRLTSFRCSVAASSAISGGRGGSLVGWSGGGVEHGQSAECARLPQPLGAPSDGARFVRRNVVGLVSVPSGQRGRPSKSLTPQNVDDVLTKTAPDRLHHYIVVSLLTGARTEELRALRLDHVHLDADQVGERPVPPHIEVWRSVREGGTRRPGSRGGRWRCRSGRRRPAQAAGPASDRAADGWSAVAGLRSGVHNGAGFSDGCGQRASGLPPCLGPGARSRSDRVDTPRTAAFVRLGVIGRGRAARTDISAGRSQWHDGDGTRISAPAATGCADRHNGHG